MPVLRCGRTGDGAPGVYWNVNCNAHSAYCPDQFGALLLFRILTSATDFMSPPRWGSICETEESSESCRELSEVKGDEEPITDVLF